MFTTPFLCVLCGANYESLDLLRSHVTNHSTTSIRPATTTTTTTTPKRRHLSSLGPRASQACQACAASKVKCDDQPTCRRCQKKQLPCIRSQSSNGNGNGNGSEMGGTRLTGWPSAEINSTGPQAGAGAGAGTSHDLRAPHESTQIQIQLSDFPTQLDSELENQEAPFADDNDFLADFFGHLEPVNEAFREWSNANSFDPYLPTTTFAELVPSCEATAESSAMATHRIQDMMTPPETTVWKTPDADKLNQDITEQVAAAIPPSHGAWQPDSQDYVLAGEQDLVIKPDDITEIEARSSLNGQLTSSPTPLQARDRLLTLVVQAIVPVNIPRCIATFPGIGVIQELTTTFLSNHSAELVPFIHKSTFSPATCDTNLLAMCMSAGAVRSRNASVRRFGFAMSEIVRLNLEKMAEKENLLTRKLHYLQAFFLQLQIGLWSGDKRKTEMASGFTGLFVNMLRVGGKFSRSSSANLMTLRQDTGIILETKWRQWIEEESFKRLAYRLYSQCADDAVLKTGVLLFSYIELRVAIPDARRFWDASTATEWRALYLEHGDVSRPRLTLHDYLSNPSRLMSLNGIQDSEVAFEMVLDATLALILEARQRRLAFESAAIIGEHVEALPEITQQSHIRTLMAQTRVLCESSCSGRAANWLTKVEYQSMLIATPFNEIEFLLGKEGQQTARKVFPVLCQWRESSLARRSIWHAGQVIRSIQSSASGTPSDFYAFTAYQAGLCLWTYSIIPSYKSSMPTAGSSPATNNLCINGPESIESQKWITHNRGVPVLYAHEAPRPHDPRELDGNCIPLASTRELLQYIVALIIEKFTIDDHYVSVVDNFCHLLEAIGKCEPRLK